ncbi:GTP cyclohydrolase I FolE [Aliiglaciecola sp. 3_MG-2023]|uniref:GTP cyclohydrolase I FolE n=1 Tax=Aliiglaciecola sp. 3_MG-2023 TaxID=3062644 RepID=UPI0026E18321|nr:GTP cyclohydrolase I FolE [Aliiglaciecola sp. 3_MG-2023]MDO6695203.1 GTP cyclohydrolase I FolE [Aliiglaciecola sp. 3_MG-2023]
MSSQSATLSIASENKSSQPISQEALMVRNALIKRGLETPMLDNQLSDQQKYAKIKASFTDIVSTLGLDLNDDSLCETPHRLAKMYVNEIFSGLDYKSFPKVTAIENKMHVDEMVKVDNISLISTCEHHFVTIDGTARVAYIPNDSIIGLSKINRIVRFFAQRPQVQERLTQQILVALQTLLNTENVAVSIDATHYCVKSRGVMDANSHTSTTALGGSFKDNAITRQEFLR